MIEHVSSDDGGQLLVVEHVNAFGAVPDGRCKQLKPERFPQSRQSDLGCSDRVGPAHTALGQAHAQAVNQLALANAVPARRGHHTENNELIPP